MAWRATRSFVGLQNDNKNPNRSIKMTFGIEAVVPMEIGVSSIRKAWYDEQSNDEGLKLALDCLPEVRDDFV